MAPTVEEVISHYRARYYNCTQHAPRRPNASNPQDRATALSYLGWCRTHDIDPLFWITDRLAYVWMMQRRAVQFRGLRCESAIPPYKVREREYQMKRASAVAASTQDSERAQVVRHLAVFAASCEQVRARYFEMQQPSLCRANERDGGGFDPRSRYCPRCPEAIRCAEELKARWGFNVVALRTKQLHELPNDLRKIASELRGIL